MKQLLQRIQRPCSFWSLPSLILTVAHAEAPQPCRDTSSQNPQETMFDRAGARVPWHSLPKEAVRRSYRFRSTYPSDSRDTALKKLGSGEVQHPSWILRLCSLIVRCSRFLVDTQISKLELSSYFDWNHEGWWGVARRMLCFKKKQRPMIKQAQTSFRV